MLGNDKGVDSKQEPGESTEGGATQPETRDVDDKLIGDDLVIEKAEQEITKDAVPGKEQDTY